MAAAHAHRIHAQRHARRRPPRWRAAPGPRLRPSAKPMSLPDPSPVLDLIEAFRRSKTMFTAVNHGRLRSPPASTGDGRRNRHATLIANPDATARLLDACAALGLLAKDGGAYRNTRRSRDLPLRRLAAHDARVHALFRRRALPDVGQPRGCRARRHASLDADLQPRWPHLQRLLPHGRCHARFPHGHARLRHADLASRGRRLRSRAASAASSISAAPPATSPSPPANAIRNSAALSSISRGPPPSRASRSPNQR